MRKLWAVVLRETGERWQFLLLALSLGVLLPAVSWLPLPVSAGPEELRAALAFGVSLGYLLLVSLLLGVDLFVSEQAAGRAGFHLALPLRAGQLLLGRLLAALVLVVIGTSLVYLPTLLLDGPLQDGGTFKPAHAALSLSVLLLIAGHLGAVTFRLRGRWTLVDLAGGGLVALISTASLQRAREELLLGAVFFLPVFLAHVLLGAFLIAIWWQMRRGGVLRGRLHAAFSLTFWPLLIVASLGFDLDERLELAKGWDDVRSFRDVVADPGGSAIWLRSGEGLDRDLMFVVDLKRDARIPLGPALWLEFEPTLAGRRVVWYSCEFWSTVLRGKPETTGCALYSLDLDAEEPRPVELGLEWNGRRPVLSPDGRKLYKLHGRKLDVYELPSLRLLEQMNFDEAPSFLRVSNNSDITVVTLGSQSELRRIRSLSNGSTVWLGDPDDTLHVRDAARNPQPPISLPTPPRLPQSRRSSADSWDPSFLGPELEPGRLLVAVGSVSIRTAGKPSLFRILDLHLGSPFDSLPAFYGDRREAWRTSYVDTTSGALLASFDGFRPLKERIDTPEGPQGWLLDEKGLPYLFDPRHSQAPLEPVFEAPWEAER